MNEQENLRTVQRVYTAFVAGDLATILTLITDDVEFLPPVHSHASPVAGWGRTWRGREGAQQYLRTLAESIEFQIFEPDEFIVGRDNVVVLGHERCRVRVTGRVVDANWAQVFAFRDGLVNRHREYSDTAAWEAGFQTK